MQDNRAYCCRPETRKVAVPLQHAVLALLADAPCHGYQLRASFEEAVGPQWGGLNIGHLYQVLDRLNRDGLVRYQRHAQPSKPDRLVYEITDAGQAELDRWLGQPAERVRGHRDDLFLKLLAAVQTGGRGLALDVIARQRAYLLMQLRAVAQERHEDRTELVAALVTTAAEMHLRADLAILDAAEQQLPAATRVTAQAAKASTKRRANTA